MVFGWCRLTRSSSCQTLAAPLYCCCSAFVSTPDKLRRYAGVVDKGTAANCSSRRITLTVNTALVSK